MSASSSWKQVAALNRVTGVGPAEKPTLEENLEGGETSRYWKRSISNGGISLCRSTEVSSRNNQEAQCNQS